jgi:hypothetical protein
VRPSEPRPAGRVARPAAGRRRAPALVGALTIAAACRSAATPPLAPAGDPRDDGVGVLARMSHQVRLDGADDDGASGDQGYRDDRADRDLSEISDPLAYAGYSYGGFGYGGFGYGGDGYGGRGGLALGYTSPPPPPPSTYEAIGFGDLGRIEGTLTWAGSAGVAWPADCPQARTAVRGAPVAGAIAYLDRLERGRVGMVQTTAVLTATACGLAPAVQLVSPVPAVVTIESHRSAGVILTARAISDEQVELDPGGRVELALDRAGPTRVSAPGLAPAWLWALPHPYYVVTDARGRFALEDVPPGNYTLVLWAPPLATAAGAGAAEPTWSAPIVDRRAVTVRGNATATVAAALTPP